MPNTSISTFGDIYGAILNRARIPASDRNEVFHVKLLVNEEYQKIIAKRNWWFMTLYQRAVQIPQKYNTGTVSIIKAASALTGTSTDWAGTNNVGTANLLAEDLIKIAGDEEIYEVRTVTDGTNVVIGTLDAALVYLEGTKTDATYEAYRYLFNLPTNFSEIVSVYQARAKPFSPLPEGIRTLRHIQMAGGMGFPYSAQAKGSGHPAYYAIVGTEAQKRLLLWPPPDTEDITIYYDYKQRLTVLSADTDVPLLPLEHRPLLVAAPLYQYAIHGKGPENANLAAISKANRDELLNDLMGDARQKPYNDQPSFRPDISRYRMRRRRIGKSFDPDFARRG